MKWLKHMVDSGDDPDIGILMNKFGNRGYYMFFRTLEIMAREFDVHNPGKNTFDFRWLLARYHGRVGAKLLQSFFKVTTQMKRIKCKINGEKISLNCPKLKELADEYTEKQLKKIGINSRPESGQNPEQRSRSKKKEVDKEDKNILYEKEFDKLWKSYPEEGRFDSKESLKKFKAICGQGKLKAFKQITNGYLQFLEHQRVNEKFPQKAKHLKTWLNNWEGERELYENFKYEPPL